MKFQKFRQSTFLWMQLPQGSHEPDQLIKYIINIPMTVIFSLIILLLFLYIVKLCVFGSQFNTELNFYVIMLIYTLGRIIYFILSTISSDPHSRIFLIGITIYHWGSTFFYTGFLIFAIYWSESKISSTGVSVSLTKTKLKILKLFCYLFIIIIQMIQFLLTIVKMYFGIPKDEVDYVEASQLLFHAILCWIVVFLFFILVIFSLNSTWSFGTDNKAKKRSQMMFFVASIICFIIFSKGFFNFLLSFAEFFKLFRAGGSWIMVLINASGSIVLDLIPTFLVISTTFRCIVAKKSIPLRLLQQNVYESDEFSNGIQNELYFNISDENYENQ